jgi:hypothetical protein
MQGLLHGKDNWVRKRVGGFQHSCKVIVDKSSKEGIRKECNIMVVGDIRRVVWVA